MKTTIKNVELSTSNLGIVYSIPPKMRGKKFNSFKRRNRQAIESFKAQYINTENAGYQFTLMFS